MNTKDKISLTFLILFYCFLMLINVRYIPGDIGQTIIATATNILTLASVAVAFTLIIVSIVQKIVGERLPWDRVIRFYLMFAILIWMFAIMYTYFDHVERLKQAGQASAETSQMSLVPPS